jgi:hypothetical protein
VIQCEVPRLRLVNGRKFSVRAYLVIWGIELWLAREFMLKVHGEPYSKDSTSAHVHIESRAASADIGVDMKRGSQLPEHGAYLAEMQRVLAAKLAPFVAKLPPRPEASACRVNYSVLGADFLFDGDGQGWLIEFNYAPCLWDTKLETNHLKKQFAEALFANFFSPAVARMPIDTAVDVDPATLHTAEATAAFVRCNP